MFESLSRRGLRAAISSLLMVSQALLFVWNSEYFMEKLEDNDAATDAIRFMALLPLIIGSLMTLHELTSEFPQEISSLKRRREKAESAFAEGAMFEFGASSETMLVHDAELDTGVDFKAADDLESWLEDPRIIYCLIFLQFAFVAALGAADFMGAPFGLSVVLSYSGLFQEWMLRVKAKQRLNELKNRVLAYENHLDEQQDNLAKQSEASSGKAGELSVALEEKQSKICELRQQQLQSAKDALKIAQQLDLKHQQLDDLRDKLAECREEDSATEKALLRMKAAKSEACVKVEKLGRAQEKAERALQERQAKKPSSNLKFLKLKLEHAQLALHDAEQQALEFRKEVQRLELGQYKNKPTVALLEREISELKKECDEFNQVTTAQVDEFDTLIASLEGELPALRAEREAHILSAQVSAGLEAKVAGVLGGIGQKPGRVSLQEVISQSPGSSQSTLQNLPLPRRRPRATSSASLRRVYPFPDTPDSGVSSSLRSAGDAGSVLGELLEVEEDADQRQVPLSPPGVLIQRGNWVSRSSTTIIQVRPAPSLEESGSSGKQFK